MRVLRQLILSVTAALSVTAGASRGNLTVLHHFTANEAATQYGLVFSSNVLYGVSGCIGSEGIFAIRTDGTGYTNLHIFSTNQTRDGSVHPSGVIVAGDMLYGTSANDDTNGTVFAMHTDGTGFTNLHVFSQVSGSTSNYYETNSDGLVSWEPLTLYHGRLYGTASTCGPSGSGTVFALNTDGTSFTNLYAFSTLTSDTNNDGASPVSTLTLCRDTFYGTTSQGGSAGCGTVFAVRADGTGFTNLYNFLSSPSTHGLALSGIRLYGFAQDCQGDGAVFGLDLDGGDFTTLIELTNEGPGVITAGNVIYGVTEDGGQGQGTIFSMNTDGSGFTDLYTFSTPTWTEPNPTNADGAVPWNPPILVGNTLYGTTLYGGTNGYGVIYALTLPGPALNIQFDGANAILSWDNAASSLQSGTDVGGPYVTISNAGSPYPIPATAAQQFFRLQSQ